MAVADAPLMVPRACVTRRVVFLVDDALAACSIRRCAPRSFFNTRSGSSPHWAGGSRQRIASNPLATSCRHRPASPHISAVQASPSSQTKTVAGVQVDAPGRVVVVVLPVGCVTVVVVELPPGVVVVVVELPPGVVVVVVEPPESVVVLVVEPPPGVVVLVVEPPASVVVVVVPLTGLVVVVPPGAGVVLVVLPPPPGVVVLVVVMLLVVVVLLVGVVVVVVPVFCGALMMTLIASPKSESRMLASTPMESRMSSRYRS